MSFLMTLAAAAAAAVMSCYLNYCCHHFLQLLMLLLFLVGTASQALTHHLHLAFIYTVHYSAAIV